MYQIGCTEYQNTIIRFNEVSEDTLERLIAEIVARALVYRISRKQVGAMLDELDKFFSRERIVNAIKKTLFSSKKTNANI